MNAGQLAPHQNVVRTSTGFIATTAQPWLSLELPKGPPCGSWVRISYLASYLDHLVRPLIRFEGTDGPEWDVMRAPLFGRMSWLGRIPENTKKILISPVDRPGIFGFEIESVERIFAPTLLLRGLRNDPKTAAMSIGARLINARRETRQALMFARGGVPIADYKNWKRQFQRSFDPDRLDAPRRASTAMPHVRIVSRLRAETPLEDSPLVRSLRASNYERWSLVVLCAHDSTKVGVALDRVTFASADASLRELCGDLAPEDLLVFLEAQDRLAEFALPCLGEFAVCEPGADMIFADEDVVDQEGARDPQLKPDWSPRFEAGHPYIGDPLFLRIRLLTDKALADMPVTPTQSLRHLCIETCAYDGVKHLRRVLLSRACSMASPKRAAPALPSPSLKPFVSIIIPTKNQLNLLKTCLEGLTTTTNYPNREILIVDNDSDAATLAYYDTLPQQDIRVLQAPGPFNFSAMCNEAARVARGDCLVFLNNDIEVIDRDWLGSLVETAMRPEAGAIGARLLFPSGLIQHAGMTIGMGGYADHTYHSLPTDDAGYLGRLTTLHEVSAVTGACIAVERRKFHAVEGFDAENLPVELNDIDLCLKLATRGWQAFMCPQSRLIHHQSASRGFAYRPFTRYGKERAFFRANWGHVIRDDPFFHPALSLYSMKPALDG